MLKSALIFTDMKMENWQKIHEIVLDALDLNATRRHEFLEKHCGANTEIRREVESLLAGETGAEKIFDSPAIFNYASFFAQENELDIQVGRQIGNYRILQEIGRGGMGAVFLAERADGEFDQQVALKIVRQTFADAELKRRFRHERQILASLNHPNIAKLLDGGISEAGEPFLAMEYVEGESIDEFTEKQNLEIEECLKLFLKVCEAVSYAHRNLIIHRDIKPSNILVDKSGEPKLLDFGLAKIFDEKLLDVSQTETAFRAFTPAYASPEQIHGKNISTASDVYSLGIVFYELLTGERPFHFENKSYEEILRSIDTQEPPPPSSVISNLRHTAERLQTKEDDSPTQKGGAHRTTNDEEKATPKFKTQNPKSLRGDLDNIALMALRKEPERRYQSVEQFASDIERHLQGLPIRARPQTVSYRASKFFQRNKIAVATVGIVILSLLTGLAIALWQANIAQQQKTIAEKRFNDVRRLSNSLLFEISPKIERLEGSTEAREVVVKRALEYLDSLAQDAGEDSTLQSELASAYEKIGSLQGDSRKASLSDFRGSIESLEKAQVIRRRLLQADPQDTENRRLLADNLRLLGIRRMYQSDSEGGLRDGKEAVSIYEKLVAENPASLRLKTALLETQIEDAVSYVDLNRFGEAVPLLQQTASRIEEARRVNPDDAETARIQAKCLAYLGHSLSWENRQPEAEAAMTRAVEITEALAARFPNDANFRQDLWRIYQIAAGIYDEVNNALMFELCEKARKVMEETIALDHANAQARHNLAMTFSRLGAAATNLGKPDEALAHLERAALILSELQAKDPLNRGYDQDSSSLHKRIGDAKYKLRDAAGALEAYEKSRASLEKQVERDPANTRVQRNLNSLYADIGWMHGDYLKTTSGQTRQAHLIAAKENYQRALDGLLKGQTKNAFSEIDRKNLEEVKAAITTLEKIR